MAVLAIAVTACGPRDAQSTSSTGAGTAAGATAGLVIDLTLEPLTLGATTATAVLSEAGDPVTGATVTIRGDMTHAGMAPSLGELLEAEPGVYRSDAFEFQMAGDWIITVDVSTDDGRSATSESFVTVSAR